MLTKPRTILVLVGIFLAGVVSGVFLAPLIHFRRPPAPHAPRPFLVRTMARLEEKLQLTAEQRKQVEVLAQQAGLELGKLRRESWQESVKAIQRLNEGIAAILTPEQKVQFESYRREQHERLRKRQMDREGRYGFRSDVPLLHPKGHGPHPASPGDGAPASPPAEEE
jgi:Spy/CpxP family protein refolding chaperone